MPGVCGYLQRPEKHVGSSKGGGMVVGFVVSHLTWLLGTKSRSSKRAEKLVTTKLSLQPLCFIFFFFLK